MPAKHQLKCPICGKPTKFLDEPVGPFCSNRCKMIDLGAWASDGYVIPGKPMEADDDLFDPQTGEPRERPDT